MYRIMLLLFAATMAFGVSVATGYASSSTRETLVERFRLSRIDGPSASGGGHVTKKGTVLVLETDVIPAKQLRFVQTNTKSPRFHVPDYARVTVGGEGPLTAGPGDMMLPRGTRLVILDLKVDPDRVRLLTHTLEQVRLPDGKTAFGCTEFVFDPSTRIDRWLSVASAT
jgi:hypothetical protein